MKQIIIIPLLFLCGTAFSQIYTPVDPTTYGKFENRLKTRYALHPPEKSGLETNTNDTASQIFYNRVDSSFWGWSEARGYWKVGTGGVTGEGIVYTLEDNYDFTRVLMLADGVPADSIDLVKASIYAKDPIIISDTLPVVGVKSYLFSIRKEWLDSLYTGGGDGTTTLQEAIDNSPDLDHENTINLDVNPLNINGVSGGINGGGYFGWGESGLYANGGSSNVIVNAETTGMERATGAGSSIVRLYDDVTVGENISIYNSDPSITVPILLGNNSSNEVINPIVIKPEILLTAPTYDLVMDGDTIKRYAHTGGISSTTTYETETAAGSTDFTFTSVPVSGNDFMIFVNGAKIRQTTDYTWVGDVVTIPTIVLGDKVEYQRIK